MISLALKLVDEMVPVLVLFQHHGKVKTYGSKNILDVVQEMIKTNEFDINDAVERDAANLADIENCDDPLVEVKTDSNLSTTDRGRSLFKHGGSVPILEPLPYPLSIMTFPETIRTLREHIVLDQVERTGLGGKIKFGSPDWEPTFWPNDLWKWTDLKCNLKNLTNHHFSSSSKMGLLEFYKLCLKQSLEFRGLDPETFYSSQRTKEELKYRQKSRACRRKKFAIVKEEVLDELDSNVYIVNESNSDYLEDSEEEKFKLSVEKATEESKDLQRSIEEESHTNHPYNYDGINVENVELEEYLSIPEAVEIETLSKKRKSESPDHLYQPHPFVRSSVICYNL